MNERSSISLQLAMRQWEPADFARLRRRIRPLRTEPGRGLPQRG